MAKRKSTSANTGTTSAGPATTHWTDEETSRLIHQPLPAAVAYLLKPLDGIPKEDHVAGIKRDGLSCKNKWITAFRGTYELGANIGPADAARWTAFANVRLNTRPFRNKGWKHFDEMDDLLRTQIPHGTNAFHAGQETFQSQYDVSNEGPGVDAVENEPVAPDLGDLGDLGGLGGLAVEGDIERIVERDSTGLDDDEDDIIPWEATPPPPPLSK
ncbi:hypothetical protein DFJ58DRAFT_725435 [Suillus subalutaceus]|uniref:uncharacterized protein n=1 Tax=Suillus subalutaceus TaxID=48586 RepID=UPI001B874907|nr:uncharacterized protein DFJ58DRAFT_725435 [Suillus subalutaceus]KAG1862013.1 hypothetical protein DFJ58DRAFT_725435 [Suillus subalutaceus]